LAFWVENGDATQFFLFLALSRVVELGLLKWWIFHDFVCVVKKLIKKVLVS
jgi:hypothetical protein